MENDVIISSRPFCLRIEPAADSLAAVAAAIAAASACTLNPAPVGFHSAPPAGPASSVRSPEDALRASVCLWPAAATVSDH